MTTPSVVLSAGLCFFLLIAPRRYLLLPFIIAACFVPTNQRIDLFNLEFTVLRFLVIAGFLRFIISSELKNINLNYFDRLVLFWSLTGSGIYILQQANVAAVINRSGYLFDIVGMYFLARIFIREWNDVFHSIKFFAILVLITAPLIALEHLNHSSHFSIFGDTQGQFHRDRYRAAGAFPHSIIMGCFWAVLLPLFYSRFKANENNTLYLLAIIAVLSNAYFSGSSTPILSIVAIIIFWQIYPYRKHGKVIFSTICFTLVCLHLVMKAPVWHLIARVNVFSGSTGWHRYNLIDKFINNFWDWFLLGTESTSHWGRGLGDLTNQFVLEGVRGGLVGLILFTMVVYSAVKIPAQLSLAEVPLEVKWLSWGLCVAMLGHFTSFWAVSYFGQINMLLYFTLALVGFSLEQNLARNKTGQSI